MEALTRILIMTLVIQHGYNRDVLTSVSTDVGTFIGFTSNVSLHNNEVQPVSRFLGIPYAKPPIGELRFKKPIPMDRIDFKYKATYHRPHCIQAHSCYLYTDIFEQSEDCLYLNVYAPARDDLNGRKRPVMVYIHGGGFECGGAQVYDGTILSGYNDVIVVVINYRLSTFGFLSDGSEMTGNYGLWDMHIALHWIHNNIAAFGGDRNAVTIFGNSAGGAAVLFLATQPLNKGLFQRVIAQSGSFLGLWAYQLNRDSYNSLTNDVGCINQTYSETLQCLRSVPVYMLRDEHVYPKVFVPTIDREFIKQSPMELLYGDTTTESLESLTFLSELDLIIGTNTNDGAYSESTWSSLFTCDSLEYNLKVMFKNDGCTSYNLSDYKDFLALYPCGDTECTTTELPVDTLREMDSKGLSKHNLRDHAAKALYMYALRDFMLFVPAVLSARLHSQSKRKRNDNGNLYFYIFAQRPSYAGSPDWLPGATHFMEIPYIFGLPESFQDKLQLDFGASYPDNISISDVHLAEQMMKLWSNFAKTGNPNSDGQPQWPLYTEESRLYLNIEVNHTEQRRLEDYPPTKKISTITEVLRNTDVQCRLIMNSSSFVTSAYTSLLLSLILIYLA